MLNFEHSERLIAKHSVISAGPCSEPFMDFIGISKINVLLYIAFFVTQVCPRKRNSRSCPLPLARFIFTTGCCGKLL